MEIIQYYSQNVIFVENAEILVNFVQLKIRILYQYNFIMHHFLHFTHVSIYRWFGYLHLASSVTLNLLKIQFNICLKHTFCPVRDDYPILANTLYILVAMLYFLYPYMYSYVTAMI